MDDVTFITFIIYLTLIIFYYINNSYLDSLQTDTFRKWSIFLRRPHKLFANIQILFLAQNKSSL